MGTVNGPPIVFFCGAPPLPAMHGLPACSQEADRVYKGYFMHPDGSFSTKVSDEFKSYMRDNQVTQENIQEFLYYNLHTTYSWATTKGNGLIRAQLVATGSPPSFATKDCKNQMDSKCAYPASGSKCYEDVIWAMSYGIKWHPDWYPGLSESSDFNEFQAFLHRTKQGSGTCPAPCDRVSRRLRGGVSSSSRQ